MDSSNSQHVDLLKIIKMGKDKFGEACQGNKVMLEIVPLDGAILANGEIQKLAEELHAKASLAVTRNLLRDFSGIIFLFFQTPPIKVEST